MNENEEIREKNTANISDNSKKICTSLMKKKCSNYEKKEDTFTSCSVFTDNTRKDLHHEGIKSAIQTPSPKVIKLNLPADPCYTEVASPFEVTSPSKIHRPMSAKLYMMKTLKKTDSPKSKGSQNKEKSKDINLEPASPGYKMSRTVSVRKHENAGIDPNLYTDCSKDFNHTNTESATRVVQSSPNTLRSSPDGRPDIIGFGKTDSDLSPKHTDSPELQFLDLSRKESRQQTKDYISLLDSGTSGDPNTNKTNVLDFQVEHNESDLHLHSKHTSCDREKEEKINMILSILPHVSKSRAALTLTLNNGNVEHCVSELLEDIPDSNAGSMLDSNVWAK